MTFGLTGEGGDSEQPLKMIISEHYRLCNMWLGLENLDASSFKPKMSYYKKNRISIFLLAEKCIHPSYPSFI